MICAFILFFTKCRFQYVCQIAQQNDVLHQIFPFLVMCISNPLGPINSYYS